MLSTGELNPIIYKWRDVDMGKNFSGGSNIESNKIKHLKIPFKFKYITSDILVTAQAFELIGI